MEFIMFLVVLKKYKYSFTLCQSITKDTLFFPTNAWNSMELVLRSISNTLRSFNFVIVEITAHSLSLHRIPMSYILSSLQHFYTDSFEAQKLFLFSFSAAWEKMWVRRAVPEPGRKDKVFKCIWKSQRFSLFVGFLIKQVLSISVWYESWKLRLPLLCSMWI